jgi:hypothetical protein
MSTFHTFLVEHANFPFPDTRQSRSAGTTGISQTEVETLDEEWKAKRAVRDSTLVQKLCTVLRNFLGDTVLPASEETCLLKAFSPRLENTGFGNSLVWRDNLNETHVRLFA